MYCIGINKKTFFAKVDKTKMRSPRYGKRILIIYLRPAWRLPLLFPYGLNPPAYLLRNFKKHKALSARMNAGFVLLVLTGGVLL